MTAADRPRSRGRAGLLLAAAFVTGIVLGALGGGWAHHRFEHRYAGPVRPGSEGFLRMMRHELDLTPTQQDSIRAIFKRRQPAMDSLWRTVMPQAETLRKTIRSEIRAQLTPEQQRRFDEHTRRMDSMRPRGHEVMHPPPPPPPDGERDSSR
jgi:Spy/CpxP family protein refolding chaperone